MQCVEFEDRLNRLLDHRLLPDDDDQLADHAHDCEACSGLLRAQQRLFHGLRAGTPGASADLADRVVSRRHTEVMRRRGIWRNVGWTLLLASAASLGGLSLMALQGRNDQPSVVKVPVQPPQGDAKKTNAGGGPGMAIAKVGPTKKVEPKAEEKFDEYFVALENVVTQIGDSKEFDEVSESLKPSIKPIRSSFGLAIDALRRTLPRGKEQRPTKPDAGASFSPDLPVLG